MATPLLPTPAGTRGGVWRRFRSNPLSVGALAVLAALVVLAIIAPVIVGTRPILCRYKGRLHAPFLESYWKGGEHRVFRQDGFRNVFPKNLRKRDPESWAIWPVFYGDPERRVDSGEWPGDPGDGPYEPPSWRHPFGTDEMGRDLLARVLYGTRVALIVGLVSMAIAGVIGILVGAVAGYFGGIVDFLASRLIEVLLSIPTLVLVLALLAVVDRPGVMTLVAVIGLTRWESIARYTRAEVLRLRESDFVLAARGLGVSAPRILLRHILPNALAPALVALTFGVANAILMESALSFLGFGVPQPQPSWGGILKAWFGAEESWWIAVFPGLAIFASVLSSNLLGDGFQEAIDPRSERRR